MPLLFAREQLGGNKYLLTDGLFVAKILDRTLVEYPAKDARCVVCIIRHRVLKGEILWLVGWRIGW